MNKSILIIISILTILSLGNVYCNEISTHDQLKQSWEAYKGFFIQDDGRVIDYYGNNITTSEGQSYAMLRAVWLNDQPTFDKVLKWTNSNIKVRGDNLFGWKWGKNDSNQWTILEKSSASDADQDIALALILANERWNNQTYLDQAMGILDDMWNKEVLNVNNTYYLAAGDWALLSDNVKINPSYFAPYAYRVFAKYDKKHDWNKLVDSSYDALQKATSFSKVSLPPDWAYINKKTGEITINTDSKSKDSDFSYDAIRVFWRIAFDYQLNKDQRALTYLNKSTNYLTKYWQINGSLPATVTIDGIVRKPEESYAIYGTSLPAIALVNCQSAQEIYHKKLAAEYIKGFWSNPKDYYGQNLIWFGIALWENITGQNTSLSQKGLLHLVD